MKKYEIIKEMSGLINWAHSLNGISDDLWFQPFREGSWGTAGVISHLISWDQFMIDNRISHLLKNESFPKISVDVEEINQAAQRYAKSGITKEQLIEEFTSTRHRLLSLLSELDEERFDKQISTKEKLTLGDYFVEMIEHDQKHKEQIEALIKHN